ncbi:alpha-actinin [Glugoides intestinalis]
MDELSSENWKIVQTKTFTKWVNNKLKKANFPEISNIFSDLSSGIALVNLLSALGKNISRYNEKPFSRIQRLENLSIILDFIKEQGIALVNIGPEDIVDGDQKLILGLVWTLISKMSISDILSTEFFTMREEILNWAQRVTEEYENVKIENLTTSWQDGLGFNAIIHKFRPKLVPDFFSLDSRNGIENCENAFKIAEEYLEIPKLFDPEDIIDVIKPDEKSILTYLSQFYQKFILEERQMIVKDRVRNILKGLECSLDAKNVYEEKATEFIKQKSQLLEKSSNLQALLNKANQELMEINELNTELITKSAEIHHVLSNIYHIHNMLNLKQYTPPKELSINKLDISYLDLSTIDFIITNKLLDEFKSTEAVELCNLKDLSKEIYSISDEDMQLEALKANESCFAQACFLSPLKQLASDELRQFFDMKKQALEKFSLQKKNTDAIIKDAQKMFKIKDTKRTGMISVSDFKKMLLALRVDTCIIEEPLLETEGGSISMEKMLDTLQRLCTSRIGKEQLKKAFEDIGNDCRVNAKELLFDFPIKCLKDFIEHDKISFDVIETYLNE